ncbi:hypothetical protein B0H16DRAFT_1694626 [Mycena metata]|uniref:Uncharacterized protein n=1 Tax=Mycena metata TaxID=1033252 RepID=A0AAD7IC39_9AGAR|nr:hypothetical protein B0H16DRAFT_1694626 [Mycena metata]
MCPIVLSDLENRGIRSEDGPAVLPHNLVKSYIVSTRSINPSAAVNGGVWTASLPPVPARLFFEADTATARNGVPFTGPVPPVKTVMVFIPTRNTAQVPTSTPPPLHSAQTTCYWGAVKKKGSTKNTSGAYARVFQVGGRKGAKVQLPSVLRTRSAVVPPTAVAQKSQRPDPRQRTNASVRATSEKDEDLYATPGRDDMRQIRPRPDARRVDEPPILNERRRNSGRQWQTIAARWGYKPCKKRKGCRGRCGRTEYGLPHSYQHGDRAYAGGSKCAHTHESHRGINKPHDRDNGRMGRRWEDLPQVNKKQKRRRRSGQRHWTMPMKKTRGVIETLWTRCLRPQGCLSPQTACPLARTNSVCVKSKVPGEHAVPTQKKKKAE